MEENKKVGKIVKVFTNELTFGQKERQVYIFGTFKYIKNNTNYIVYSDINNNYNLVYYATAHIKENSILTLDAKREEDSTAIKEYIYKLTNNESLQDYKIINIDNINMIEIIGFNKIEVKPEIISSLINLTIPKEIKEEPQTSQEPSKKKKNSKLLIIILLLAVLSFGAYMYLTSQTQTSGIEKYITCKISYHHKDLNAIVYEEKTLNFNNKDTLETIETLESYVFSNNDDYLDFINKGLYYKYMSSDNNGGYKQEDENNTFKITTQEKVDISYKEAINYEEVLTSYKSKGYSCDESINE